jgi:hypothetical protein
VGQVVQVKLPEMRPIGKEKAAIESTANRLACDSFHS